MYIYIIGIKLYMFRAVSLSIIRRLALYTQQWCMSLLCVQRWSPDDGQRKCPKHVEFYSKNKFEKLVHLIGFMISTYHDARSSERQKASVVFDGHVLVSWYTQRSEANHSLLQHTFTASSLRRRLCLVFWVQPRTVGKEGNEWLAYKKWPLRKPQQTNEQANEKL